MRKLFEKLYDCVSFLKVASICLAALYLVFWFYRFLDLPFAQVISPCFDFFITPIKNMTETVQIYKGAVIEMGYFAIAIILVIATFILSRIEILIAELARRSELKEIAKKKKAEKKMNAQLQDDYNSKVMEYKYYSVYITYKIDWASSLVAQGDSTTIIQHLDRTFMNTVSLINQYIPTAEADKYGASVFIRGVRFDNFDESMGLILDAIKVIKKQNASLNIKTDFMIVCDAQSNMGSSQKSYETLVKMAGMDYFNKAIVTSRFKMRFDLIADKSNFMTETLGLATLDKTANGMEYYNLKTKPKQV